jgi:hypothetical protein
MRITLDIPDEVHAKLKALAKKEGTTMRAIILRGIDAVLNEKQSQKTSTGNTKLRFPIICSSKPGTLKLTEEGVYEYIEFP